MASAYVWVMRNMPRFMVWSLQHIFLPILQRTRIDWFSDPSMWEAKMRGATDCGAVFRRLG
jgi:hypothetical protein